MEEFAVHCIAIYRNKKDPSNYTTSNFTVSGENIRERIDAALTTEASSLSDEWELVAFSHTFLPLKFGYQMI